MIIVPKSGVSPEEQNILDYMRPKVAKWWMPDAVEFVDEIPHTATGKIQKMALRDQFADYAFS